MATEQAEAAGAAAYRAARAQFGDALPQRSAEMEPCTLSVPGSGDEVVLDHLGGARYGMRLVGTSTFAFGPADEALARVLGAAAHPDWVAAVARALARERAWEHGGRLTLSVLRGEGEMFHVTSTANRASIERHGLDWARMGAAYGIGLGARPPVADYPVEPELEAVFLVEDRFGARFFTDMGHVATDVWAVDVTGRWLETGPSGWWILPEPVPPHRVRLVERDVTSCWPR